jgi:hypothetical protein
MLANIIQCTSVTISTDWTYQWYQLGLLALFSKIAQEFRVYDVVMILLDVDAEVSWGL